MPAYNGSGPGGMGPMTGCGRGYCITYIGQAADFAPGSGRGGGRRNSCFSPGKGRRSGQVSDMAGDTQGGLTRTAGRNLPC